MILALLRLAAWLGAAGLAAATLATLLASVGYPFELAAHFHPQWAAAGLGGALAALIVGAPRAASALVLLGLVHGALLLRQPSAPLPLAGDAEPLVVIWANLHRDPSTVDGLIALAEREGADLVMVTEAPDAMRSRIAAGLTGLACRSEAAGSVFGVAAFATEPCRAFPVTALAGDPDRLVRMEMGGVQVTGLHAARPDSRYHQRLRDRQIDEAFGGDVRPQVMIGDFNATPWSPVMRALGRRGWRRAPCGGPLASTWITRFPVFGLPIDHAFVAEGFRAECAIGPDLGSDHLPLVLKVSSA